MKKLLFCLTLAIAMLFLRNQVRSLRRLAIAAEAFGRGVDVPTFRPQGATERAAQRGELGRHVGVHVGGRPKMAGSRAQRARTDHRNTLHERGS